MAKYSFEFKKKVVNSYLNGEGSLNLQLKNMRFSLALMERRGFEIIKTLAMRGYSVHEKMNYIYQVKSHIKIQHCKKVLPPPV